MAWRLFRRAAVKLSSEEPTHLFCATIILPEIPAQAGETK